MRRSANSDSAGFGPANFVVDSSANTAGSPDKLVFDAPSALPGIGLAEQQQADAAGGSTGGLGSGIGASDHAIAGDYGPVVSADASAPSDGTVPIHGLAGNDSFLFGAIQSAENDYASADSSGDAAADGLTSLPSALASHFGSVDDGAFTSGSHSLLSAGVSSAAYDGGGTNAGDSDPANAAGPASSLKVAESSLPLGSPAVSGASSEPAATAISAWDGDAGNSVAGLSGAQITDGSTHASVGAGGATAAQVQLALDESGLSVNGSGIRVGVLSDSFNDLGGASADEASGALPSAANIDVIKDLTSGGSDEGRAMMQIIHDIAPGASLAFYTAFDGEQDFANGILALAAAGCKVIVDDVSYFDEPFFQNGVVAQAIQTVEAEGVTYVTAAGNDASNAYQAAWTPTSGTYDGVHLTDAESFGGSLVQTVTVGANSSYDVPLLLEWNQAYGAATSDLEVLVFSGGRLLGGATNASQGEPTNPWIGLDLPGGATYQIAIENLSGPNPGLIKEIAAGDGLPVTISGADVGTVYGHAMTPGAITAGAVSAADTPAFGVGSVPSETFSSSGAGTELLFANNGTALSSPDLLSPVAVSGVDDIATTVPGGLSDFYGTSAASASLAGVAALILSADPNLTPAQVEQIMEQTALPMANSAVSGAGLVQVDPAVADALSQLKSSTPVVTIRLVSDTGWSSSDGVTANDALTGTADANAVVTLAEGTKKLGTATANASGVWSFTPTGLANGQQTIVASETNSGGHTGTASLTFTLDTTTPTVISDTVSGSGISGGAGTLVAGQTAVLTLATSEAVKVSGGAPALILSDGGTATYDAAHSTSQSLVFDYTVAAGQYASALAVTGINLYGATVTEIAGNAANLAGADVTFSHLVVDATTPVAVAAHAHDTLGSSVSISHAQAATGGVLANDSDADSADILSVSAVNGSAANVGHSVTGAFGALTLNSDGSYTYTNSNSAAVTALGGVAEDMFNYTVNNGHGGTATSTLAVVVTSPGETYIGGASGSAISAGNGSYVLDGTAGNMNLTAGQSGTQWLFGGAGDTLNGSNSADTFLFAANLGKETVNNFTAQDVIDLPQSLVSSFAALQADMHASGANTVITFDANDAITLSHVAAQNLHAQNFHFVA